MKRLIYCLLSLVVLGFGSCSKEVPIDIAGDVQFKLTGTLDGNPISYEAGENNYKMGTDYSDNGVNYILQMGGEFVNKSDPTGDLLRFEFFGYDSVDNNDILQNVFSETTYPSYSRDSLTQKVGNTVLKFHTLYGVGANVKWDFGDGSTGSGDTIVHSFANSLNDARVTMNSYFPQFSCGDQVANDLNLIDPQNNQVQFDIDVLTQSIDSFRFIASANFNSYSWDFDNQQGAITIPDVSILFQDSSKKNIELTAIRQGVQSIWKAVVTPNSNTPCFAAYRFDVLALPTAMYGARFPYKTCVITYKKNGKTYSSFKNNLDNQSSNVVFTLNSAAPYLNNENGEKTIRLTGSVNTMLYNVSDFNDSMQLISNNVSIAVAHP